MRKAIFIIALSVFISANTISAQTVSFNENWKFIGLEFANKEKVDSLRKLGNKWEDQFLIQQVETKQGYDAVPDYNQVMDLLKGKKWQNVSVPHIAFPEPLVIVKPREGMAYYTKDFTIDKKNRGKIITIEFEAVMQVSNVWVNGKYMGRFTGGYLPFEIDITNVIHYGEKNTLLAEANNKGNPLVPPGKPIEKLDFMYYSGIYRDVWLHYKNPLHITNPVTANQVAGGGIFVSYPKVAKEEAVVDIQTHIENKNKADASFVLLQELVDKSGKKVAEAKTPLSKLKADDNKHFTQQLVVRNPSLWHPDHPYLYSLRTKVMKGNSVVDEQVTRIGIRSIEISREKGLLINGEKYRITGTNRHQNYPYIGNAISNNANYRDAWLIKNAGMSGVRTAHYPPGPSFIEAADELGILVINAIPGWQFFNRNQVFQDNVMKDIRNTIRLYRNHPSIFLWEMSLNESYPPAEFRCKQAETAREEWGDRKGFYTGGDSYFTKACWDVPYDDWNEEKGPGVRDNVTYPDKAFIIREYGDYEFGGGESTTRQLRGAGQQGLLQQAWNFQWEYNKNLKNPYCIGEFTWAFFDGLGGVAVGIEGWGSADIFRIPKYSYYFYKSQQPAEKNGKQLPEFSGEVLFIANDWAAPSYDKKVVVYSNCEEVALYVNDKLIARQKPDNGPETEYGTPLHEGGKPFDGGNANRLKSPPFTFTNVDFVPGTLRAEGIVNGKTVKTYQVTTPSKPVAIALEPAINGKAWQAERDMIFVYAKMVDEKGNFAVTNNGTKVSLKITAGNAEIISPAEVKTEAGIATFIVRSGTKKEKVVIEATADGLKAGQLAVDLK